LLTRIENEFYSKDNNLKQSDTDDENIVGQVAASWEVRSFLVACEAIIRSALMRQESRAHYRSDFPNLDDDK